MNISFTANKLFVLAAVLVWSIVAIIDIADLAVVPHELGWVAAGLSLFGISFLL